MFSKLNRRNTFLMHGHKIVHHKPFCQWYTTARKNSVRFCLELLLALFVLAGIKWFCLVSINITTLTINTAWLPFPPHVSKVVPTLFLGSKPIHEGEQREVSNWQKILILICIKIQKGKYKKVAIFV
jgi:hypothetical protein